VEEDTWEKLRKEKEEWEKRREALIEKEMKMAQKKGVLESMANLLGLQIVFVDEMPVKAQGSP